MKHFSFFFEILIIAELFSWKKETRLLKLFHWWVSFLELFKDYFTKKFKVAGSHEEFSKELQKVKRAKCGEYTKYPVFPLLHATGLMRFDIQSSTVLIMNRQITQKLFDFLEENYGKKPAVYIHGTQGVGKSHR